MWLFRSIQPPGQVHEVYTPVPTISTGAHFYSYDTMHMTELVRMYDKATKSRGTNHQHESALLTLQGMVNAVKDHPRKGKSSPPSLLSCTIQDSLSLDFPKKGMSGLCRMITNPDDYFADPFDNPDLYRKRAKEHEGLPAKKTMTLIPEMDDARRAAKNAHALIEALGLQTPKHLTIINSTKAHASHPPASLAGAIVPSVTSGDDGPSSVPRWKRALRKKDPAPEQDQAREQAKSPFVDNAIAKQQDCHDYIFVDGYFNPGPPVDVSGVTLQ